MGVCSSSKNDKIEKISSGSNQEKQENLDPEPIEEKSPWIDHDKPDTSWIDGQVAQIKDSILLKINAPIGSVNQITYTVDILENNELMRRMGELYR